MDRTDDFAALERAWASAERALPPGWRLDGLRCQSTGLAEEQRSEAWRAVARGPAGEEVSGLGASPLDALEDLARKLPA